MNNLVIDITNNCVTIFSYLITREEPSIYVKETINLIHSFNQ